MCDHLHEQTSRYDSDVKVLTFLLVCPTCETERVVEELPYEPRFKPCALPGRRQSDFVDNAAPQPVRLAA
jgi:hypothetical protein